MRLVTDEIPNPVVQKMDGKDQWAYTFIKRTCRDGLTEFYSDRALTALSSASSMWSLKFGEMESYVANYGLSSLTNDIIHSKSLPYALVECYPNSSFQRKNYLLRLIYLDNLGTFAGTVTATAGVWKVGAVVIEYALWRPVSALLKKSGISKIAIERVEKAFPVAVMGIPTIAATIAGYRAEEKKYRKVIDEKEKKDLEELAQMIQDEIQIEQDLLAIKKVGTLAEINDFEDEKKQNIKDINNLCTRTLSGKDLTEGSKSKANLLCLKYI